MKVAALACLVLGFGVGTLVAEAPKAPASAPASRPATTSRPVEPADKAIPRGGLENPQKSWMDRHARLVERAKAGGINLYFVGDSITDGWQGKGKAVWAKEFAPYGAGNFGIGGDRTQNVLYRLENGEFEGVTPKLVVLMIGTNNHGSNTANEIAAGVKKIIETIQTKSPTTQVLLLAVFPRSPKPEDASRKKIEAINVLLAPMGDGKKVHYLDIGKVFLEADGTLSKEIMPDFLHLSEAGYQRWADAIRPKLREILGEPPATAPATAPAK